jgi:hypothetical protein
MVNLRSRRPLLITAAMALPVMLRPQSSTTPEAMDGVMIGFPFFSKSVADSR